MVLSLGVCLRMESLLKDLFARGLVQDHTDESTLRALPAGTPFYFGADPTASSLHVGNLLGLILVMRLGRGGLKPIMLFGGATGAIGDPSGRSAERPLLTIDEINANIAAISSKVESIFTRAAIEVEFVNNIDWFQPISYLSFLREVGKYFSLNVMLAKDTVRSRLEGDGISYTEFSYSLLQAYDFAHLYQTKGCRLQVGGADQWGNMTAGLELIRKKLRGEACALSAPLVTDSEGRKLGKSTGGGSIWLNEELTSPYQLHQYFLNIEDSLVIRLLKWFTFLTLDKVQELEAELASAPEKRTAQHALADAVCRIVHGDEALDGAKKAAHVLFGGSLVGISDQILASICSDTPSSSIPRHELSTLTTVDLAAKVGLTASKGEARRLLQSGGLYLNNERISDLNSIVASLIDSSRTLILLRSGKKNYHLVRVT